MDGNMDSEANDESSDTVLAIIAQEEKHAQSSGRSSRSGRSSAKRFDLDYFYF